MEVGEVFGDLPLYGGLCIFRFFIVLSREREVERCPLRRRERHGAIPAVEHQPDRLAPVGEVVRQRGGEADRQLGGRVQIVLLELGGVEVEEQHRVEGDGRLVLLDLQATQRCRRTPVDAAPRVPTQVVAHAGNARGVLVDDLVGAKLAERRARGQVQVGERDDLRVDGQVVRCLGRQHTLEEAEDIAKV